MASSLDLPALLGGPAAPPLRGPGGARAALPPGLLGSPDATLGLYFSAHWCPPCRKFTPKLAAAYAALMKKEGGTAAAPREIVFVSADRTRGEYEAYADSMPFPALPYDDGARERLMGAVGLAGIPCLVIVSGDGRVLQRNGRACVAADPAAAGWPYEGVRAGGLMAVWTGLPPLAQWCVMGVVYVCARWALWGWRGGKD
jgi:thiol-disulfide isomerase/thioredoxin